MSNLEIQALKSLEKFQLQKQRMDLQVQAQKQEHCLISLFKDWCAEILVYFTFIGIVTVLAGIFIVLGAGALVLFSIIGLSLYLFIYKKNKKEIYRKNQQKWLLQAPNTQQYIQHLTDFESVRIPLLIYAIYMVDAMQMQKLEQVAMYCAEKITSQTFQFEWIDAEFRSMVHEAKNEYSFGLNQVAEVFYVLVTSKHLNLNIIEDLILKLYQSLALEQKDFIEREDIHLYQVLNADY